VDGNGPVPVFHWPFDRSHRELPAAARKEGLPAELIELAPLSAGDVLERLGSRERGLTLAEAESRRTRFGANRVAHEERETLAAQLLRRLLNPLNVLLLALAGVSVVMGDIEAAIIIFIMVALSLALAITQERRSSLAAERLRAMVHTTVIVVRATDGAGTEEMGPPEPRELPLEQLVPGDVVHLSAGDMIP